MITVSWGVYNWLRECITAFTPVVALGIRTMSHGSESVVNGSSHAVTSSRRLPCTYELGELPCDVGHEGEELSVQEPQWLPLTVQLPCLDTVGQPVIQWDSQ